MTVSKQAIKRINEAEVTVKLWNGCFNVATAYAEFSRYTLELRIEVTHKELVWQCGDHKEISFVRWVGCTGHFEEVPPEMYKKVEAMKKLATMTDSEAKALSTENNSMFIKGIREPGIQV